MVARKNLVRVYSSTTGSGDLRLGLAVEGCLTFAQAGIQNGDYFYYGISDGVNSEVGLGSYFAAGPDLLRETVLASTNGGSEISCTGNQEVFITVLAEDLERATGSEIDAGEVDKVVTPVGLWDSSVAWQSQFNGFADGRLTLTSGDADILTDTNGSTVYYTPFCGNRISLFDGSYWRLFAFSELSVSLAASTPSRGYDLFCYNNSGTPALEALAWSSATARATALVRQDGVLVKSGAATRRYLGSVYLFSDNKVYDDYTRRYVWNNYNRLFKPVYYYSGGNASLSFFTGDPHGVNLKWSTGGSVNNTQMMYSYSTIDPSGAPGHGEYGKQDSVASVHGSSQTIMTKFAAGYAYIQQTPSSGTVSYGRIIGEVWC